MRLGLLEKAVIDLYQGMALSHASFSVGMLPKSANKQYRSSVRYITKNGRPCPIVHKALDQDIQVFRLLVRQAISQRGIVWKPSGVVACVLGFASSKWVTKKNGVAVKDVDNLVKPTCDAIAHATQVPDQLNWHIAEFKIISEQEATHVWLYDLGNIR